MSSRCGALRWCCSNKSSNSSWLAEIAIQHNIEAILIDDMKFFDPSILKNKNFSAAGMTFTME